MKTARVTRVESADARWNRLLVQVMDFRDAERAGDRGRAWTLYKRGIAEFGDEQWEHALDYVITPTVKGGE